MRPGRVTLIRLGALHFTRDQAHAIRRELSGEPCAALR